MTSTDKFLILLACLLAHRTTSNRIWPPNFKMTSWREEKSYFRSWHQYANLKHPVRVPFLLFHTHSQRGYFLGVFDCCRPFLVECFMTLEPLFKGHIPMSISHSFAKAQLKNWSSCIQANMAGYGNCCFYSDQHERQHELKVNGGWLGSGWYTVDPQ